MIEIAPDNCEVCDDYLCYGECGREVDEMNDYAFCVICEEYDQEEPAQDGAVFVHNQCAESGSAAVLKLAEALKVHGFKLGFFFNLKLHLYKLFGK